MSGNLVPKTHGDPLNLAGVSVCSQEFRALCPTFSPRPLWISVQGERAVQCKLMSYMFRKRLDLFVWILPSDH